MKRKIRIVLIACAVVLAVGVSITGTVLAMPNESAITANCRNAQSTLGQIEKSDVVLRINRGRSYNDTLELFFAMNARLSNNRIAAPHLAEITSDFNNKLTAFRNDYNSYDDLVTQITGMDCVAQPNDFYNQLNNLRAGRDKLASDVTNLNQLIDNYRNEFNSVVKDIK